MAFIKFLVIFASLVTIYSLDCPKWGCSQFTPEDYCYRYDEGNNFIHVSERDNTGCSILHFRDDPVQNRNSKYILGKDVDYEKLYESKLRQKYCDAYHIETSIECFDYCYYQQNYDGQNVAWTCDFELYQAFFMQSSGLKNYAKCNKNEDCLSRKCECVPSTKGDARCTSSVKDSIYEYYFESICGEDQSLDVDEPEVKVLPYEDQCKIYIWLTLGNYIEEFNQQIKAKELQCLQDFSDVKAIVLIDNHVLKLTGEEDLTGGEDLIEDDSYDQSKSYYEDSIEKNSYDKSKSYDVEDSGSKSSIAGAFLTLIICFCCCCGCIGFCFYLCCMKKKSTDYQELRSDQPLTTEQYLAHQRY